MNESSENVLFERPLNFTCIKCEKKFVNELPELIGTARVDELCSCPSGIFPDIYWCKTCAKEIGYD